MWTLTFDLLPEACRADKHLTEMTLLGSLYVWKLQTCSELCIYTGVLTCWSAAPGYLWDEWSWTCSRPPAHEPMPAAGDLSFKPHMMLPWKCYLAQTARRFRHRSGRCAAPPRSLACWGCRGASWHLFGLRPCPPDSRRGQTGPRTPPQPGYSLLWHPSRIC